MYKIISVVGARPNFMKIAPIVHEINRKISEGVEIEHYLVHTGQHYSPEMSGQLFTELNIPEPDINLEVGSGTHGQQTGQIIQKFEKVLLDYKPELVVVVGDVNSTIACAIDAKKMGIQVAHVESGLRSFDMGMPEEINRVLTDRISDYLFTTEESAQVNLKAEGIPDEAVHFVGNVMIDTLLANMSKIDQSDVLVRLGFDSVKTKDDSDYVVVTMHRPSNVDQLHTLSKYVDLIVDISKHKKVVFPVHPRTYAKLEEFDLLYKLKNDSNVILNEPLTYLDFIKLVKHAYAVLTDSGGIQEETTVLGVHCLTMRENTERPVTIDKGTNHLVGVDPDNIRREFKSLSYSHTKAIPDYWDGQAAKRIVDIIVDNIS